MPISPFAAPTETSTRPRLDRRRDVGGIDAPVAVDGQQRDDAPRALEGARGVEHRGVLGRDADEVVALARRARRSEPWSARLSLSVAPLVKTISRGSRAPIAAAIRSRASSTAASARQP